MVEYPWQVGKTHGAVGLPEGGQTGLLVGAVVRLVEALLVSTTLTWLERSDRSR